MSSRNRYLSVSERKAATVIYRALTVAQEAFAAGQTSADKIRYAMMGVVASEPMADLD